MISFKGTKPLKDYDAVSLAEIIRGHFALNYPVALTTKLNDAIQVASYLHRHDVRRGNRGKMPNPPYIEHPLRVAIRMFRTFGVTDAELILAAILHDTVEDHPFEFADFQGVLSTPNSSQEDVARDRALQFIANHFGYKTTSYVEWVSNPIMPGAPSKAEKVSAYHQHVEGIASHSHGALILKFSDFIDNAGSLHHHYEYDDPKAKYFVDRYSPLVSVYESAFGMRSAEYDSDAALERLGQVQEQFAKFQATA